MHHSYWRTIRSSNNVNISVYRLQWLLQNIHRESRCTYRNITSAFSYTVGAYHARTCITLWWCHSCASLQHTSWIQQPCTSLSQSTGSLTCWQNSWQNILQLPRQITDIFQFIEFLYHILIIGSNVFIYWEHTRSIPNTQYLLTAQLPMNVASQGGEELDFRHMRLLVQHSLINMSHTPSLRNVEFQSLGQVICCFASNIIAPSSKWHQQLILCIKSQITMHHGTDTNGADSL